MAELKHPIREIKCYLLNASTLLSEKAGKDGDYYSDKKYVKIGRPRSVVRCLGCARCRPGYKNARKRGQRFDIQDNQEAVNKIDNRMKRPLLNSYKTLHKVLGYDDNLNYHIIQLGLKEAQYVIEWAGKHYHDSSKK
ncbi:MAG: DUF5618 family protein [Tannerella sp.]|jgi:hypothetical protein|nr:DUF5618 family protein [Tannerella sp.]